MNIKGKRPISVNQYRTHTNNELSKKNVGERARLSGWVQNKRDHGNLVFIDLRDKWGITQLAFNPSKDKESWQKISGIKSEYVITVEGIVAERPIDMVNDKVKTGEIELLVDNLEIISTSKTPPFLIETSTNVNEELRLKYRFLDLRHPRLQKMMRRRDELTTYVRQYMKDNQFTEVQTPILANSSPEGARDFLIPSRLYPGKFYALPQAPQQFKQLLMIGGLDRYFQIAPCFRDEDPRQDRHSGDFYQIDMEMSFVEQEDVFAVIEPLMTNLTKKFSDKKIQSQPFPRISWHEAISKYGSDKPDLRYGLEIVDISKQIKGCEFKQFADVLEKGGFVQALRVENGASFSRSDIEELTNEAKTHNASGLAYILIKDKPSSPIIKYLGEDLTNLIIKRLEAHKGNAIFFVADKWQTACQALGAVRKLIAKKQNLADQDLASWCWITDFPMYEYNEQEGKIDFSHNPFSMPQGGLEGLEAEDPTTILGYQYDLTLNGYEISSGAIRNHRPDIMYKAFSIAGFTKEEVDKKFGAMIRAFNYGAPPHGGMAPGIDRLLMVLWNEPNIREIYAFPKNGKAQDVMMGSPSEASNRQLKDLHIKICK